ncbi:MAG: exodeoxyribonuclease III [Firmicutes bacterium]|nr:exodeoxyribonuclease III [Bacillota bacterium]
MLLTSWNVNGLRAALKKGFMDFLNENDPNIIGLQETKMVQGQAEIDLPKYEEIWNSADKKGYSGTAIFTKEKPLNISLGIGIEEHDKEGRVITLELEKFFFVNVYTPNSKEKLARIDYRVKWENAFRNYLMILDTLKPVIICGDLNVAHTEIDLKNPKANRNNAGFSDQERGKFSELLESGFVDSFRYLYPDAIEKYTWWSYRFNARVNNAGWRIDYFLVSDRIKDSVKDFIIHDKVEGSDHCPVSLIIDI